MFRLLGLRHIAIVRRTVVGPCRPLSYSRLLFSLAKPHCRMMSTPAPRVNVSDLSMERYHALSDTTMDSLLDSLESLLDNMGNPAYEVEYHSGVLTLALGDKGTYVINKQPPNKQIWVSSPFSGPKRYDYSEANDVWLYSRDGRSLGDLLSNELSRALDREVDIGIASAVQVA